jgi:hypothetical protein
MTVSISLYEPSLLDILPPKLWEDRRIADNFCRPTRSRLSSRLLRLKTLSPSGPTFSPRYECNSEADCNWKCADILEIQALEGKDVKDLLLNVGSGGGAAAAAPSGGAAAGGEAAAEEAKEEEKEEGMNSLEAPELPNTGTNILFF